MIRILLFSMALLTCFSAVGQRHILGINSNWQFAKEGCSFSTINLPHTYNGIDAFDDEPGYYRGNAEYIKLLDSRSLSKEKQHFIRFGAVNQEAILFINGKEVGSHSGGYTSFTFDITEYLTYAIDTIKVEVDNSHNENIPPLKGDFTFYGGIYRSVELISVNKQHFSFDHHGSDGVYVDPLQVTKDKAELRIRGYVDNCSKVNGESIQIEIGNSLLGSKNVFPKRVEIINGFFETQISFVDPILWTLDKPELYNIQIHLLNAASEIVDKLSVNYGLRDYSFDPDKGFYLNGEHVKLIGVNRHQDKPNIGNALLRQDHISDMNIIKEMGANFLRTAHYPQDKSITEYCDRNGILVSIEIPLDHEITQSETFSNVCKEMTLEMIHQYYNHPSVIIWAYMNEMGLGKSIAKDSTEMKAVASLASELENLIRIEDPYRYTMIPNHGDFDIYKHFGLTDIPMLVGWNLYYGWYEKGFEGFGKFVDHAHRMVPNKPMLITEYGAGADQRISSRKPLRFDFSLEWSYAFHESHLKQILERDFIAGSAVWNMFDFGSESRQDAVPHVNNKGLCSFDRKPKPVFFLYQDVLRLGKFSKESTQKKKALRKEDSSSYWRSNESLSINMGAPFEFTSSSALPTWKAGEMESNLWHVEGGELFGNRDRGVGSDRAIALTDLDPIFQTQLVGIEKINIPVPKGEYKMIIHLARLLKHSTYDQFITIADQTIHINDLIPFTAYSYEVDIALTDHITVGFNALNNPTFLNGVEIFKK